MRPVAVIGSLSRDSVDGGPRRIGGAAYYAARALRLLGRPARIVAKLAGEDRAAFLPRLAELGLPVSWRAAAATPAFSFTYEDGLRRMRVEALGEPWTPEEARDWVAPALMRCEWIHVGALHRNEFPAATLAALRERGRRILLDGQGLVRPAEIGPLQLDGDYDPDVLRQVSILKLDREEARALVGEVTAGSLAELGVGEVIVTLEAHGSLLYADGRLEQISVHRVDTFDPTGAGDGFAAAYLASRSSGDTPATAARRASTVVAALLPRKR